MYGKLKWIRIPALLALLACAPVAWAGPGSGLKEIPDSELADMRGRFTVGDSQVLWFGVSMVSSWYTASGQLLQGRLDLGFDMANGTPVVSFEPSVTVTDADAPMPVASGDRSIGGAGLANVGGMVQSVQVAGDGNRAANTTALTVRDGQAPTTVAGTGASSASAAASGASATATFDGNAARVLLQVAGHGTAEQWIRPGSLGQQISLASDGQAVSNQLQLELVRHALPASAMLGQNVAQSIQMTRGIGGGL